MGGSKPGPSMDCRKLFAISAVLFIASGAWAAAKDCPTLEYEKIEQLLAAAPSCDRSMALFSDCAFGSSGDVGLGTVVIKKCEGVFLAKLSKAQRRVYDRKVQACWDKYAKESGTMYRSMSAFCAAGLAQTYAARAAKAKK
jgi:hypothetical protein